MGVFSGDGERPAWKWCSSSSLRSSVCSRGQSRSNFRSFPHRSDGGRALVVARSASPPSGGAPQPFLPPHAPEDGRSGRGAPSGFGRVCSKGAECASSPSLDVCLRLAGRWTGRRTRSSLSSWTPTVWASSAASMRRLHRWGRSSSQGASGGSPPTPPSRG